MENTETLENTENIEETPKENVNPIDLVKDGKFTEFKDLVKDKLKNKIKENPIYKDYIQSINKFDKEIKRFSKTF